MIYELSSFIHVNLGNFPLLNRAWYKHRLFPPPLCFPALPHVFPFTVNISMHHCHIGIFVSYRGSASLLKTIHAHSLPHTAHRMSSHTLSLINTHVHLRQMCTTINTVNCSLRPLGFLESSSLIQYHVRRHSSFKGQSSSIRWNL